MPEVVTRSTTEAPLDLAGRRFYRPGVLAVYSLFILPLGLLLYGINLVRRNERLIGYPLIVLCSLLLPGMFVLGFVGTSTGSSIPGGVFLSIFIAIYMMRTEADPYVAVIARGGQPARWWPPLVAIVIVALVVAVVMAALMSTGV